MTTNSGTITKYKMSGPRLLKVFCPGKNCPGSEVLTLPENTEAWCHCGKKLRFNSKSKLANR